MNNQFKKRFYEDADGAFIDVSFEKVDSDKYIAIFSGKYQDEDIDCKTNTFDSIGVPDTRIKETPIYKLLMFRTDPDFFYIREIQRAFEEFKKNENLEQDNKKEIDESGNTNDEVLIKALRERFVKLTRGSKEERDKDKANELLVRYVLKKYKIITTREDVSPDIYIYLDGIYIPKGRTYIEETLRKVLIQYYTPNCLNLVIAKIRADTYLNPEDFFNNSNLYEIALLNGVLDTRTRKLRDYDITKDIFFHKQPIKFNPKAKCPNIDKHFEEVLKSPEDKKVLYEVIGYTLDKTHFIEKAIMLTGSGRNGKGKTLSLIKNFLGAEACASIPLISMREDSFNLEQLHGKAVNLAGDLSNQDMKSAGLFKSLTGRDVITAHRKFKSDLIFVSTCKHIFACNELPKVYDVSKGFFSRWILLEFPFEFVKREDYEGLKDEERKFKKIMNVNVLDKLSTEEELSGLLNLALDGLDRLRENSDFSYSIGTDEIKEIWIRKSNSFTAFCWDCITEDEKGVIVKSDLRRMYNLYRKKYNLRGAGDKEIKATLEDFYGVGEGRAEIDGEWVNTWTGISYQGYQGKKNSFFIQNKNLKFKVNGKNPGNPGSIINTPVVLGDSTNITRVLGKLETTTNNNYHSTESKDTYDTFSNQDTLNTPQSSETEYEEQQQDINTPIEQPKPTNQGIKHRCFKCQGQNPTFTSDGIHWYCKNCVYSGGII